MEQQLQSISEQQRATWNKSSAGWKKWDELMVDFLKPNGDEIIRKLQLKPTDVVLDVAAGTGEPGLTIATMLTTGKMIITDIAESMLDVARESAATRRIKNVEFLTCDAGDLPFADNTFDAISCRLGFMFFSDMLIAVKEMVRVLKPGGRIAASVWNVPEKNPWVAIPVGIINKNMILPAPPPGAPGMFRCAKQGLMEDLFIKAGLKNISQKEIHGKLNSQTTGTYWGFISECVGPVVNALSQADDEMKNRIQGEVYKAVIERYSEGQVSIDANAIVISGQK